MIERGRNDRITKTVMLVILTAFAVICVVPMLMTISISFSDEKDLVLNGYRFVPRIFSTGAYAFILDNPSTLLNAYAVTIATTALGTALGVLFMSMAAYPLSRPVFRYRKAITFYIFFTMLFSGGLVPTYIVITRMLHLQDTLWVIFLPVFITAWNVFLLITYMRSIPLELVESAKIDGARELTIYARIILPMAKPALATVALLLSLRLWNEWYTSLLYIRSPRLVSLQFWMQRVMQNMQFLLLNQDLMGGGAVDMAQLPTESARMAMAVLAAGPMMFVFPFFQKYFTKGLLVGSLKG
jgi:putative aldouronate transport system permease protein